MNIVELDIHADGLFIKPIAWAILNNTRLPPFESPEDYERYNYKDFPYLNITYVRFELVIFDGMKDTVAINYTARSTSFMRTTLIFQYTTRRNQVHISLGRGQSAFT